MRQRLQLPAYRRNGHYSIQVLEPPPAQGRAWQLVRLVVTWSAGIGLLVVIWSAAIGLLWGTYRLGLGLVHLVRAWL